MFLVVVLSLCDRDTLLSRQAMLHVLAADERVSRGTTYINPKAISRMFP